MGVGQTGGAGVISRRVELVSWTSTGLDNIIWSCSRRALETSQNSRGIRTQVGIRVADTFVIIQMGVGQTGGAGVISRRVELVSWTSTGLDNIIWSCSRWALETSQNSRGIRTQVGVGVADTFIIIQMGVGQTRGAGVISRRVELVSWTSTGLDNIIWSCSRWALETSQNSRGIRTQVGIRVADTFVIIQMGVGQTGGAGVISRRVELVSWTSTGLDNIIWSCSRWALETSQNSRGIRTQVGIRVADTFVIIQMGVGQTGGAGVISRRVELVSWTSTGLVSIIRSSSRWALETSQNSRGIRTQVGIRVADTFVIIQMGVGQTRGAGVISR
ncbi:Hypothetical_protein [Hexamita inflata]|uniref:Hypothetical_protein n=1 Tax=Hexamita inflata TaxID=28002 RepID=A0AA86UHB8_9EUKA|nr:Hypothetical protein HINF_LOCUS39571 [Hexamita inflata]